jgi:hypothetical protein
LVSEVNKQVLENNLDYVFIAGDFTHYPDEDEIQKMETMFAPLKDIKVPVYAVLGNHDLEKPGPKLRQELSSGLKKNNVKLLNNDIVDLKGFKLVGLGDHWALEDDVSLLDKTKMEENVIVLTHNPDTTLKYTDQKVDLTVAGHTHGGQVKIYPIYKPLIPTSGDFDEGLIESADLKDLQRVSSSQLEAIQKNRVQNASFVHKTFVTSGVGETAIPIRFFNPPVIDIIQTY